MLLFLNCARPEFGSVHGYLRTSFTSGDPAAFTGATRQALSVVVVLLVAFAVTAPFTNTQLPRVDAFIPALETAIVYNDLITSALLFGQFYILRWPALLVLANGYLFTALIIIPHALTLGMSRFLLNIEKRSLPRLMLSGDGLASKDAV